MTTAHAGTLLQHIQKLVVAHGALPGTDRQLLDDFSVHRDEAAFSLLVARHGPMVLRVCRRVLHHEQDAEDAFQATFLVLARQAGSIRQRETVANWLHGVAYRTAMKAKRGAARRRNHEGQLRSLPAKTAASPRWDDVQAVLDEEIQRLPDLYRSAFVLCVLESKSGSEAAAVLGIKEGTVSSRLTRARQRLRRQLARRGIKLAALLAALAVAESAGEAGVPGLLSQATIRCALLVAAGEPAAGVIPWHVAALAAGVSRAMFLTKAKMATAVLVALVLLVAGGGAIAYQALTAGQRPPESQRSEVSNQKPAPPPAKPAAPPEKDDRALVSGRVVGPDGRPVPGARLFLCDRAGKSAAPQPATDAEGRFRFALPTPAEPRARSLLATAAGLGLDWAYLQATEPGYELTLRLPADVPVRGKVVTLEGKPVAGAAVRIVELSTSKSGSLDEFLKQWAADKEKAATGPAFHLLTEKQLGDHAELRHLATATTGPDGSFRLTGIGRDRGLMLGVRGPGIADHYARVITRPDFAAPAAGQGQVALSGPEPVVVVAPNKPILGTLRDAKTKEPLAGVRVRAYTPDRPFDWWWQPVETVTDARGGYRLDGLAKRARQIVTFDPGPGAPHMHRFDEVSDTQGFAPIVHDSQLYRGAVVSGQVADRSTGRPVRARVVYAPLWNNENFRTTPGYAAPRTQVILWIASREMVTGVDGRFRLTALPGPGALFVRAVSGAGPFTTPAVPKEEQDPAIYRAGIESFMTLGAGDLFPMPYLHAYRLIRPGADATELSADFALDPGKRRRGRLLGPDGRPLSGVETFNLTTATFQKVVLTGDKFTAEALNPARPRRLLFWHHDRKLAGTILLRGDEPEPVTVTLQPLAALTGRAVRKTGEPLVGYAVEYAASAELEWPDRKERRERQPMVTDKEGRFRIADLPAGVPLNLEIVAPKSRYAVIHREQLVLDPDKTRDLGDLRGEPEDDEP